MTNEKQTLVNLTQGFLKILAEANGADVELSYCEKQLKTTKRRLYDVVNVLSGVNLVERSGKSKVHRTGDTNSRSFDQNITEQESELDHLLEKADSELNDLSNSELFKKCAWLSKDDLDTICYEDNTLFYSLMGPPTMKILMRNDDHNPEIQYLSAKVDNGDEPIVFECIKSKSSQ